MSHAGKVGGIRTPRVPIQGWRWSTVPSANGKVQSSGECPTPSGVYLLFECGGFSRAKLHSEIIGSSGHSVLRSYDCAPLYRSHSPTDWRCRRAGQPPWASLPTTVGKMPSRPNPRQRNPPPRFSPWRSARDLGSDIEDSSPAWSYRRLRSRGCGGDRGVSGVSIICARPLPRKDLVRPLEKGGLRNHRFRSRWASGRDPSWLKARRGPACSSRSVESGHS